MTREDKRPPSQFARSRRIKNTAPADKLTTMTPPKTSNPASSARSLGIAGVTKQRKSLRFALANTDFVILRADIETGILWSRAQKIPMGCFTHTNPNGPIELGRQSSGGSTRFNDWSAFSLAMRQGGSVDGGFAESIGAMMKHGLLPLVCRARRTPDFRRSYVGKRPHSGHKVFRHILIP